MQSATFNVLSKSGKHRQRIAERSENSFVAGWSRSTQHATIRYDAYNSAIKNVELGDLKTTDYLCYKGFYFYVLEAGLNMIR